MSSTEIGDTALVAPRHRTLQIVLALITTAAGLWLVLRPLTSVSVLLLALAVGLRVAAVFELVRPGVGLTRHRGVRIVLAVLLALLSLATVLWPGLSLRLAIVGVATWLLIDGARDVFEGLPRREHRWSRLFVGPPQCCLACSR